MRGAEGPINVQESRTITAKEAAVILGVSPFRNLKKYLIISYSVMMAWKSWFEKNNFYKVEE
uniref:Uncharacterized protein n=1 Tax=Muribaculaceae bacterium Z82 TaxID=2304548 RepID=A0A7C9JJ07_9BACT